jgi:SAM-dependent methyltransferase
MKNKVEEQYTRWVYPLPLDNMRDAIDKGTYWEIGDPLLYWPIFWPERRGVDGELDILCAGCGTNQAAYYACRNPNWNILGIDLSESSLAHQQMLKEKHGLNNLRLKKLDLTKIETLGENFDFITSTGVLHHLPDPDEGLKALASVLRPEGVMNLMVYGKSLRLGVYLLQEAFKLMDLHQTEDDILLVKEVVNSLPAEHVVKRYVTQAYDLEYDSAYVDTFLHPQDQAFWVKDVYAFTRRAGLEFLSWCDPVEYSLKAHIPATHPIWPKLQNLSPEVAAHVCDLLAQARGTHRWAAAHPDYVAKVRIPFETDAFWDCTVGLATGTKISKPADSRNKVNAECVRGNQSYLIPYQLAACIGLMGGKKSLRLVMDEMSLSDTERANMCKLLKDSIRELYDMGHLYVILPEVS